ncbi:WXG100 family type VII secretion target, partial [Rhodococcus chondri]
MNAPAGHLGRLLDSGAVGLRFFSGYLPHAHRLGVAGEVTAERLYERYDEQRDLDVSVLEADAAVLARLARDMEAHVEEQAGCVAGLTSAWSGDAGSAAHDVLGRAVGRGAELAGAVRSLAGTLAGTADGLVAVVTEKSGAAAQFADATIGGRTAADVEAIVAGAAGESGRPTAQQLAQWDAGGAAVADPDAVARWCERWLAEVFVPAIETAIEAFIRMCDDADRAVEELFDELAGSFDSLDPPVPDAIVPGNSIGGAERPEAGDLLDPGTELVAAATGFAVALGGFAEAVLDLATTAVRGATAIVEAGTAAAEAGTEGASGIDAEGEIPSAEAAAPVRPPEPGPAAGVPDNLPGTSRSADSHPDPD